MEEYKLRLEILKEIHQIEINCANRQYPEEVADYLLKKNKKLLEELSSTESGKE